MHCHALFLASLAWNGKYVGWRGITSKSETPMATKVQVGSALNPEDGGQELR
jgi:hypothetical protein